MNFKQTIENSIIEAIKNKDSIRANTLRSLKTRISTIESSVGFKEGDIEENKYQILNKEVKLREDAYDAFFGQNRLESAAKERAEIEILQEFLPKQLTQEELIGKLLELKFDNSLELPKDSGKLIGLANKNLVGITNTKLIREAITKL